MHKPSGSIFRSFKTSVSKYIRGDHLVVTLKCSVQVEALIDSVDEAFQHGKDGFCRMVDSDGDVSW
ncbi:hypothetical protein BKM10_25460 [Pseudomonas syringae pv. syringae]|nr:hypothetical protein BKM10_25460 [Pseudomonas syringae pv. syringae]